MPATDQLRAPRATPPWLTPVSPPLLFVVVDTEEEFDWSAPFASSNTDVSAMRHVCRGQRIFDRYGIRPTYVVDFPVASQVDGYRPLREIADEGRCLIGAHMHPWVNPPYHEPITSRNSFTCNLAPAAQASKLRVLFDTIASNFGHEPKTFKAGRYGLGAATVPILEALGFSVDTSINPRFNYSPEDGPDFLAFDSRPFFVTRQILEIPCTVDYVGALARVGSRIHPLATRTTLERLRVPGILARTGVLNRVQLSPEGNSFEEMRDLASRLVGAGHRTLTLSFHSTSLDIGHSPYVQSARDLGVFLDRIERFCEFFMTRLSGRASTFEEFRSSVVSPN